MQYIFPFQLIEKGSKIVLYGAGRIGYEFYRQLKTTEYCQITAWVDRQHVWCRSMNLPVEAPSVILERAWDKIVLAVDLEQTADDIRTYLLGQGIAAKDIVYSTNYWIGYDIVKKYSEDAMREDAGEAYLCHPKELLSEQRLDLVIRALYAQELLQNKKNGRGEQIYTKFIQEFCGAQEGLDDYLLAYFSEYEQKNGMDAFKSSFAKLVKSIGETGFLREKFVPLDETGQPFNGAHRFAAALAMDMQIWVRKYPYKLNAFYAINKKWLAEHGFTEEEIKLIYSNYVEMVNRR